MVLTRLLSAVLALLFATVPATGQVRAEDGPKKLKLKDGVPWKVWVAVGGLAALEAPRADAKPKRDATFEFMEECYVCGENGKFLELAKADATGRNVDKELGWVDEDYIVLGREALRHEASRIFQKAMIINSFESVKAAKSLFTLETKYTDNLDQKTIPEALRTKFQDAKVTLSEKAVVQIQDPGKSWLVLDPPLDDKAERQAKDRQLRFVVEKIGEDTLNVRDSLARAAVYSAPVHMSVSQRRSNFQLLNIFFVWKITRDERDQHVLLGATPSADDPRAVMLGWIPKQRVTLWETREAVEWDFPSTDPARGEARRKEPGFVFQSPKDALVWLRGGKESEFQKHFKEAFDKDERTKPMTYDDMRLPILGPGTKDADSGQRLLSVGWVGGLSSKPEEMEELKALKRKLELADKRAKTLELVFVIDGTISMSYHFEAMSKAVRNILTQARKQQKADQTLRVAISYYYNENTPPGHDAVKLQNVILPNMPAEQIDKAINDLCEGLKNRKHKEGVGDRTEMVFEGIKAAIENAKFSQYARKVVIVIGDDGDKPDGKINAKQSEVADAMFSEDESLIELYVVQVEDREEDSKRHPAAKHFESQMQGVVKLANQRANDNKKDPARQRTVAHFGHIKIDSDLVAAELTKRAQALQLQIDTWTRQLAELRMGNFSAEVAPELEKFLEDQGIKLSDLRKMEGTQLYQEGYTWENTRGARKIQQVRTRVLLSSQELDGILDVVEKLLLALNDPLVEKKPQAIVKEVAQKLAGDRGVVYRRESISEVYAKIHGLPFKSALLTQKPDLLRFNDQMEIDLKLKLMRLKDIQADQRNTWVWDEKARRPIAKDSVQERRFFKIPGSELRWYWLDLEEEIP